MRVTQPRMTGAALAPAGRRRRACRCPRFLSRRRTGAPTHRKQGTCAQRLTRRSKRCSSSPAGSLVRPVCTAEDCTIVLDGAVSQWKRSEGSEPGDRTAAGRAGRDALQRFEMRAHAGRLAIGRHGGQRALVELRPGAEEAAVCGRTARRPRSGIRRARRAARRGRSRTGSPHARARSASSIHSRGASSRRSRCSAYGAPSAHSGGTSAAAAAGSARGASRASASASEPAVPQQHVVADRGERPSGDRQRVARCRGARRAPRRGRSATGCRARGAGSGCAACGRRSSTSASSQTTPRPRARATAARAGAYGERAGQEVDAEVEARAGADQVLDLGVRLGARQLRIELARAPAPAPAARARGPARRPRSRPTSAFGPCPAPRNLTTYRPSSSASTSPGSEPPSRSGVT